jgi:hypothetical protein
MPRAGITRTKRASRDGHRSTAGRRQVRHRVLKTRGPACGASDGGGLHALRHSYASLLFAAARHVKRL